MHLNYHKTTLADGAPVHLWPAKELATADGANRYTLLYT